MGQWFRLTWWWLGNFLHVVCLYKTKMLLPLGRSRLSARSIDARAIARTKEKRWTPHWFGKQTRPKGWRSLALTRGHGQHDDISHPPFRRHGIPYWYLVASLAEALFAQKRQILGSLNGGVTGISSAGTEWVWQHHCQTAHREVRWYGTLPHDHQCLFRM